MDNSKKSVHNSGPLGMLVKTGQIKKVDLDEEPSSGNLQHVGLEGLKTAGSYFKTQSGINFREGELVFVDPKECESWEYANRSDSEMGEMDELVKSIRENNQLQPALVRSHPTPHGGLKYQIIFGRRRHVACLMLGIPFLVIKKDTLTLQEAIACQDAENKFRKDVSNYSNALLYRKLLEDKAFKTEKELAEKLRISPSSLNELMAYAKLPTEIVSNILDIHQLPAYMATKIVRLLSENKSNLNRIIAISPEIGRTINTPSKLEMALTMKNPTVENVSHRTKVLEDRHGKKLFAFKVDHKGVPSVVFQKNLLGVIDFDKLCEHLQTYINDGIKFGRPNLMISTETVD